MSGDVQPRKRNKDKRRKRDDDESSHGVHITKMGSDDVHLHVQHEHGTGGHWCAKIIFFSLMAVLLGLVGLIILENRGLSDLDTPLSESRFSNYFDGWVEEHRDEHEHDDAVQASIEDHDEHDEPFEEVEENLSELDEAETAEEQDEEETLEETAELDDEELDEDDDDNDNDDDDEEATAEETIEETVEENNEDVTAENEDENVGAEVDDEDEDDEDNYNEVEENNENAVDDDDDDNEDNEQTVEQEYATNEYEVDDNEVEQEESTPTVSNAVQDDDDDDDDIFDEDDDDDDTFESIVDNDAEELLLLQQKAASQAAAAGQQQKQQTAANVEQDETDNIDDNDDNDAGTETSSWAASPEESPVPEVLMKRRLTIASPEEQIPEDAEEPPPLDDDEDYSEEEIEIEEEIEVYNDDEDGAEETATAAMDDIAITGSYVPETFEQLQLMYRPKHYAAEPKPTTTLESRNASILDNKVEVKSQDLDDASTTATTLNASTSNAQVSELKPTMPSKSETTHAVDHIDEADDDDDIDYDEHDLEAVHAPDEYSDEDTESYEIDELDDDDDEGDDISDVDDSELMNRLEAKYGRLPSKEYESDVDPDDPTWTQIKPKVTPPSNGPQSVNDNNDAEESDDDDAAAYELFEQELRRANEEMLRENYSAALQTYAQLTQKYSHKPKVFLAQAKALDQISEIQRSNKLLADALEAYKRYLAFERTVHNNDDDEEYRDAAEHCIERMRFMGYYLQAVPIHKQLIERFPDEPKYRNQLSLTYLMMNRLEDVRSVSGETLRHFPADGLAQLHFGFALKQFDNEKSVHYMRLGLDSQALGTQEGFFYFTLGETLQRLNRQAEALEIYQRGANLNLFPSVYQRSLYNVAGLRAQAYWTPQETSYALQLLKIKDNWRAIRNEALKLLNQDGYFIDEAENLRAAGDWKQFELYARGQRRQDNCQKAPITCGIIAEFAAARSCRRGQVKFSVIHGGTHVWPHCGPTNCRLRAHLGLVVPPQGTGIRVAEEMRTWTEGEFLIFDDSFEHEVWHNGTSLRLVLIIDVWHPDLNEQQRETLTPI